MGAPSWAERRDQLIGGHSPYSRGTMKLSVVLWLCDCIEKREERNISTYRWSRWTSCWRHPRRTGTKCRFCQLPSRQSAEAWTSSRRSWPLCVSWVGRRCSLVCMSVRHCVWFALNFSNLFYLLRNNNSIYFVRHKHKHRQTETHNRLALALSLFGCMYVCMWFFVLSLLDTHSWTWKLQRWGHDE